MGETKDPLLLILGRLESLDARMNEGFARLEERIGGLEERIGGLEERIDGLEERMGALEQRVEQVYQELDRGLVNLHADLNSFAARTEDRFRDLGEELKWLREKWMDHDRDIYYLKRR